MKRYLSLTVALCATLLYFNPLTASAHMPPPFVSGQPVPTLAPMIKRVTPAVVNVSTRGHVNVQANPFFNDPFFQQFFGNQGQQQMQRQFRSLGSGVIVDADKGYILTNNHVVENADQITVTLNDNRSFKAKVIGTDPDTDIAVLKIDAKDLTAIPLGDSAKLQVGDFVVAIGNPFGLNHSVTAGIVSAKGRGRNQVGDGKYEDFIQTDASINPGNSGGALVDLEGNLVGINTAILSRGGGNIGIGFAIPIDMARTVMEQLIKYGKVERGVLGVGVQDLTPELAKPLGINVNQGAIVSQVTPGSEAEKAGIKANDVITSVNGSPVTGSADVSNAIGVMRVGSKVTLGILRDGKPMTIVATIGKRESESISAKEHPELMGLSVSNMDAGSPLYGQVKGVQVTGVDRDSEAYTAGLRPGDIITGVNRTPISNVDEFRKVLGKTKGGVALRVQRQDQAFYVVLQ
jgi:Do/DeqQ family serine protease